MLYNVTRLFRRDASRGSTLVEQAIVLPVVIVLALAAVDGSNLVQAYSALREGVKDSLRCVYPVEGKCIDINFNPPKRLFDWYLEEHGPDSIVVSTVNYSAQSSWIRRPDYIYNNSTATILGVVNHQIAKHDYTAKSLRISATSKADVVMLESSIPAAKGDNAVEKRDPNLFYVGASPNSSFESSGSFPVSGIKVTMADKTDTTTFHVPFPKLPKKANTKCFLSNNFDKGGSEHEVDLSSSCSDLPSIYAGLKLDNPWEEMSFILHVKGATSHTDVQPPPVPDYPDCALKLSLTNQGISSPGDKGGFQFDGTGYPDGYFVPRGGPKSDSEDEEEGPPGFARGIMGSTEYVQYPLTAKRANPNDPNSILSADIDLSVELTSTLWQNNVEVPAASDCEWHGTTATIYAPTYTEVHVPITCAPLTLAQAQEPDLKQIPCTAIAPSQLSGLPKGEFQDVLVDMESATSSTDGSRDTYYGYYSPEHLKQYLASKGIPATTIDNMDIVETSTVWESHSHNCAPIAQSTNGSSPNYGVAGNPNVESINAAMVICPPLTPEEIALNAQVTSITYTEIDGQLLPTAHQGQEWKRENCNESDPTLDGPRLFYPKLDLGPIDQSATNYPTERFEHTGNVDPKTKLATTEFNCGGFDEGGVVIDGAQELPNGALPSPAWTKVAMPNSSLFNGTQEELGDCQLERLKNEALSSASVYGMTNNSYFTTNAKPIGEKQLGDIANCGGAPTAPPSDECVPYRTSEGALCTSQKIASALPEGTEPPECMAPDATCSSVFSGFDGVIDDGRTENYALAADIGSKAMAAAYPRGIRDCEGENCFNIKVEKSEDNKRFIGKGTIKVPMTLLAGSPITLSYSDQETAELEFVKN